MIDGELVLERVHDYSDVYTRARLRRVVRHLPEPEPWGVRHVHAAFKTWTRHRRPLRRSYRNSWCTSRARRTDETPILTR